MTPTERLRAIHELATGLTSEDWRSLREIVRLSEGAEADGWTRCDERMPADVPVWVYTPTGFTKVHASSWSGRSWRQVGGDDSVAWLTPTHWMPRHVEPVPAPPKAEP